MCVCACARTWNWREELYWREEMEFDMELELELQREDYCSNGVSPV